MKFLLLCFVFNLLYGLIFCDEVLEENFCSILNETSEHHLLCKNGFNFPLNSKYYEGIKITELSIHSENLTDIKSDDFKDLPNLTFLDLSKSNLQNIDEDAFANLKHLKIINLSHNKDLKIPNEGPLFYSNSLRELILKDVGIKTLPDNIFTRMPDLEILNLENNEIEDIEKALENTNSLEKLTISKSNLEPLLLCERTSLEKIETISYNDENEKISNTLSCVTTESETKKIDVPKKDLEKSEETTTISNEDNEEIHKEFCLDEKNFAFNGKMECKVEDGEKICQLSCSDGMKPNIEFKNPYKCSFKTGVVTPVVPICSQENTNSSIDAIDVKNETSETDSQTTTEKEMKETSDEKIENKSEENQVNDEKEKEENVEEKKVDKLENENDDHLDKKLRYSESASENSNDLANEDQNIIDGQVGESKPGTEEGINGSSVVLGIIIVVLVLGGMGMGYKYWKNHRGYHNTRTEDVEEGKEMKTINSANKTLVSDQNNE